MSDTVDKAMAWDEIAKKNAEIAGLRAEIVRLKNNRYQEGFVNGSRRAKEEAQGEIERLRVALKWYADPENYDTGQDCLDVLIDGGRVAREALAE